MRLYEMFEKIREIQRSFGKDETCSSGCTAAVMVCVWGSWGYLMLSTIVYTSTEPLSNRVPEKIKTNLWHTDCYLQYLALRETSPIAITQRAHSDYVIDVLLPLKACWVVQYSLLGTWVEKTNPFKRQMNSFLHGGKNVGSDHAVGLRTDFHRWREENVGLSKKKCKC